MAGVEQLVDSFSTNVVDSQWLTYSSSSTISATNEGIRIVLAVATGGANYAGLYSATTYSLVGSSAYFKASSVPTRTSNAQMYLKAYIDGNNYIDILYEAGNLYFRKTVAGVTTNISSVVYSSNEHVYWRLREVNGTTYYDTSPDGIDWVSQTSIANPIALSALVFEFGAGTYQSEVSPGQAEINTFNTTQLNEASVSDTRKVAHNLQVSWKKDSTLGGITFTIGVSIIGGNDIIGISPGSLGSPGNYRYMDESASVMALAWERGLKIPTGGLNKAFGEAVLDNTSNRFTPRYMGGVSELFTAEPLRSPFIINAGFEAGGVSDTIPQFSGVITRQPRIDIRDREYRLAGADYTDFFDNRYLDQEVMFTAQRTDQVYETLLQSMGLSTAQYTLDTGINIIDFGLFEKGTRYSNIFNQLAEAENGQFYQDESGEFRFENRQHWDNSPHNSVSYILSTSQVLQVESPRDDHLINVVEIRSPIREKQPLQTAFNLPPLTSIEVPGGTSIDKFFEFQDPVLALTDPTSGGANSFFVGNSAEDESGTDMTSNISFKNIGTFAKAVKYRITNSSTTTVYVTQLVLGARVAKKIADLYYREKDDSSVTAYQERVLQIDNDYIQSESWAASYARMILNDFSEIEKLQRLTVRAVPAFKLGDLISWQGKHWRIFDIKATLDAGGGFVQELTVLQRTITTYFRIGISTIGSSDMIAP